VQRIAEDGRVRLVNGGEAGVALAQVEADLLTAIDHLRSSAGSAYRESIVESIGDEKRADRALGRAVDRGIVDRDRVGRRSFFTLREAS
jgi:hypothetical protein